MVQHQTENIERKKVLQRMVLEITHHNDCKNVNDVINGLQQLDKSITLDEILNAMEELKRDRKVTLSDSKTEGSFWKYIMNLSSTYFWVTVAVSIVTLTTVYLTSDVAPWSIVRIMAGALFMLFIPGYALIHILFVTRPMDAIEQIALSIGLSLAVAPLIGLMLNYSYWGVSLDPMLACLSILSIALAFFGDYRKFSYHRNTSHSISKSPKLD